MSKITIPPASKKILDREAELTAEMSKYSGNAFEAIKHARLEAARDGSATPNAIKELSELSTLEKEMHEHRESVYHALQGLRDSGFLTLRDEVIKPMLLARQDRREQLDTDVQALRAKYPGLEIGYDHSWDSGSLHHLRDLCQRSTPHTTHTALGDIVAGYSI
ncbi:MAG: hypothetical protein K8R38_09025 [Verrucomicrobia bacterium]|nr:hypothetical protein [Verrucomicrobiota bacterium]